MSKWIESCRIALEQNEEKRSAVDILLPRLLECRQDRRRIKSRLWRTFYYYFDSAGSRVTHTMKEWCNQSSEHEFCKGRNIKHHLSAGPRAFNTDSEIRIVWHNFNLVVTGVAAAAQAPRRLPSRESQLPVAIMQYICLRYFRSFAWPWRRWIGGLPLWPGFSLY